MRIGRGVDEDAELLAVAADVAAIFGGLRVRVRDADGAAEEPGGVVEPAGAVERRRAGPGMLLGEDHKVARRRARVEVAQRRQQLGGAAADLRARGEQRVVPLGFVSTGAKKTSAVAGSRVRCADRESR